MSNQTAITAAQIELVKDTWAKVVPIADTAAKQFYDRLFETNPQMAPMFDGTNLPEQRRKLMKAINMAVISLERFETMVPVIRNLGYNHVFYGVKERHYGKSAPPCCGPSRPGLATSGRTRLQRPGQSPIK